MDRAVTTIQITAPALRKGPGKGPGKRSRQRSPQRGPPAPAAENCRASTWVLLTSCDVCVIESYTRHSHTLRLCSVPKYLFLGLYVFPALTKSKCLGQIRSSSSGQPLLLRLLQSSPQAVWKQKSCHISVVLGRMKCNVAWSTWRMVVLNHAELFAECFAAKCWKQAVLRHLIQQFPTDFSDIFFASVLV